MLNRKSAWLAWIWCGLIVIIWFWGVAQAISDRASFDNVFAMLDTPIWSLAGVVFAFVGALIVSRQPRNTIGWLMIIPALVWAFTVPEQTYVAGLQSAPANPSIALLVLAWLDGISWVPMIFSVFFILQLFPKGRPLSPRWRWLIAAGLVMAAFFAVWAAFAVDFQLRDGLSIANPIGFLTEDSFPMGIWLAGMVLLALGSAASLFLRYRRAGQAERKQIKWLLYACGLFVTLFIPGLWLSDSPPPANNIWGDIWAFTFMAIPVGVAIAVLRYQLYDIDVIIRKTVVYAILTALLALVYFGVIVVLQSIFEAVSGQRSPIIIVISTLIIAALFAPLRRRVQDFIDRRFYRRRYDAERTLAAFAQFVRDETDLEALTAELQRVVTDTMQPDQVGLWIRTGADSQQGQWPITVVGNSHSVS